MTNDNFGSDRTYYWTLSRRRRLYSHAKPISLRNRVVEFLKADDPPGRALHEHDFLAGFLADILLVAIAEPTVRVRPSLGRRAHSARPYRNRLSGASANAAGSGGRA
jgi:hypothetical protein